MKKSILFGALAFFAISALGIQDANAQNDASKNKTTETTVSAKPKKEKQPAQVTVDQTPVKQKTNDCCSDKKNCNSKKVTTDSKAVKKDAKQPSAEKDVMKPATKNETKNSKLKKKSNTEK